MLEVEWLLVLVCLSCAERVVSPLGVVTAYDVHGCRDLGVRVIEGLLPRLPAGRYEVRCEVRPREFGRGVG